MGVTVTMRGAAHERRPARARLATDERPSAEELAEALDEQLGWLFPASARPFSLSPLPYVPRDDAPLAVRVRDAAGDDLAAVLCSAPRAPTMVERAMDRALEARALLGQDGCHVLEPLTQGRLRGLSYAVLPWCSPLAQRRPLWWVQRRALQASILEWTWRLAARTARPVPEADLEPRFMVPLSYLTSLPQLSAQTRRAAERAAERIADGSFRPRKVLMHGDLWKGNILLRPHAGGLPGPHWSERFAVIDWPAADPDGHPFYDLVRVAHSFRVGPARLRAEVERHCLVLEYTSDDAMGSLLAALGQIGITAEHFPIAQYTALVEDCRSALEAVILLSN